MNHDDLLKMLDLPGKEVAPEEAKELAITPTEPEPTKGASPTALELDEWGLRRGREILDDSERAQQTGLDENAIADCHGVAFEPDPKLKEDCIDPQRSAFLAQLLETPDYRVLHESTMLDAAASAIAACAFAEQLAALKKDERKGGAESLEAGKDVIEREMATLRAVGKALSEASKDVEECKEAAAALGLGPGAPGNNDPRAIAALYRRVRGNPTLRRICALAGRYRRLAQSRQRMKSTHGIDDVVGVVLDVDIGRLLPHELAKLADDDLADDTLRRLIERQTMCREYQAVEPVAKGPIILAVDESGSMQGDKVHTAKALALAMAWVARRQRRWCALVAYSGDSGERLLALPLGRWDEHALANWLCEFIGRGSSLDVPVREMPRIYQQLRAPPGQTDIIFITDALCRIPADQQCRFVVWKRSVRARLVTLVIDSAPGDLQVISDEIHLVQSLSVCEAGVERVLSI
jgi:uncharacterized protein with von Willebrand factor type A (vWA) domain